MFSSWTLRASSGTCASLIDFESYCGVKSNTSLKELGRHSTFFIDFLRLGNNQECCKWSSRSSGSAPLVYSTGLCKNQKKGCLWEIFIHCKIFHKYYVSFLHWSSLGCYQLLSGSYLTQEPHYFLYYKVYFDQLSESSRLEATTRNLWLLTLDRAPHRAHDQGRAGNLAFQGCPKLSGDACQGANGRQSWILW